MTGKLSEDEVREALMGFHKMLLAEAEPKMVADMLLTVATVAKAQSYGMIDTARHLWVLSLKLLDQPTAHLEAQAIVEANAGQRSKFN